MDALEHHWDVCQLIIFRRHSYTKSTTEFITSEILITGLEDLPSEASRLPSLGGATWAPQVLL